MADYHPPRVNAFFSQDVELVEAERRARGVQGDGEPGAAVGSPRRPQHALLGGRDPCEVCANLADDAGAHARAIDAGR